MALNSTDLLLIPIALIVTAFLFRWYADFVDTMQDARDRRLRAIQIDWLRRCYSVSVVEQLDRTWFKQTMDEKYDG
jgi:hypothetical protein